MKFLLTLPFFSVITWSLNEKKKVDHPKFLGEEMYTGYVHMEENDGEMFYAYFEKRTNPDTAPLLLWLTGGPGCSSEIAWLSENGPFWVKNSNELIKNNHSWNELASMVYLDQPLGTGFSMVEKAADYARDEDQISKDVVTFLKRFLELFPELVDRDFYITGESYAGHYIPAIAHQIILNPIKGLNFKGIAIGNGWVDPFIQYPAYADFSYQNGLINERQFKAAKMGYRLCDGTIKSGSWELATIICQPLTSRLLGSLNPYDIREKCEHPPLCYDLSAMDTFLNRDEIKEALGVTKRYVECNFVVHLTLLGDWISSMRSKVAKIIEEGRSVLIYNGAEDFICNWVGGMEWVDQMNWDRQNEFTQTPLKELHSNNVTIGEAKMLDNIAFVKVTGAGHMVPMDQPVKAIEMMKLFLNEKLGVPRPRRVMAKSEGSSSFQGPLKRPSTWIDRSIDGSTITE